MAVTGLVSKPTFGYLSEHMTARRAMMLTLSGQCVGAVLLVLSPVFAWVGLPIFGVSMGAHSALMPLLVQESFGSRYFGSIMGTVTMFSLIPFGLAPLIAGRTFDVTQSYTLAYLGFAALFVIAAAGLNSDADPRRGGAGLLGYVKPLGHRRLRPKLFGSGHRDLCAPG